MAKASVSATEALRRAAERDRLAGRKPNPAVSVTVPKKQSLPRRTAKEIGDFFSGKTGGQNEADRLPVPAGIMGGMRG